MLTRAQKEEQVAELQDKFRRATSVVVAEYRGLGVQASEKLRKQLRAEGAGQYEYRVTKNSLLRRAAEGSDVAAVIPHFKGPTAVAIAYGVPDEAWGSALQLGINLGAIATAGILTLAVQRWLSRRRRPAARA